MGWSAEDNEGQAFVMPGGIVSLPSAPIGLGTGSALERVIGTKLSGPQGIEAEIEYNSLFMNVREWIDTYLVTSIAGRDDADIRTSEDPNPGNHGVTSGKSLYGGRTIVLNGKIRTKTLWKLRDMESALKRAFRDPDTFYPLIIHTGSASNDMQIWCKKNQQIQMLDEQTTQEGFVRPFQITLRADFPFWTSYIEQVAQISPLTSAATTLVISQNGNRAAYPVIRIYGPLNAAVNGGRAISIKHEETGKMLWLKAKQSGTTLAVADGNYIELDATPGKRRAREFSVATGAMVGWVWDQFDENSDWIELLDGDLGNHITVDAEAGLGANSRFEVRYRTTVL